MKQLTCEICGSTDFIKQDGAFVCQGCGIKYTAEDVKKMLSEGGEVEQNAPSTNQNTSTNNTTQIKNILTLAHSSFDSKNYAQSEEFCNQVIALDASNYDAWKLKGEAINFQISAKNQRILEVYNCIMTSYKVLSEDEKQAHRDEILNSVRSCLESEIDFWLKQFESQRPTDQMLEKVKRTFKDCTTKIIDAYIELGYSKEEYEKYKDYIYASFVKKCNQTCVRTWNSTVFYNYNRDGWNDSFRPTAEILKTYIKEGDNLISLLDFCTGYFSKDVTLELRVTTYENIIFYEKKLCESTSYKRMVSTTTNGYGAVTNRREYWEEDQKPTSDAIKYRQKIINNKKSYINHEIDVDSEGKTVDELFELAKRHLSDGKPMIAERRFNAIEKLEPQSPVGPLGKAVSILCSKDCQESKVIEQIEIAARLSAKDSDKEYIDALVNYPCGEAKMSLLMITSFHCKYNATEYLISLGADINQRSYHNCNALWYLCHDSLSAEKVIEGRMIAQLLLEKGADVNVVNKGGVALYNKKTDPEIANMFLAKDPSLQKGVAPASKKSGGCYVATAVYGSYDCPQVWTLRRYRDFTLAKTWYGRAFVRTYYAISPTIVKWFGDCAWFKKMWQPKLDRMVNKLRAIGFENTPYDDREW